MRGLFQIRILLGVTAVAATLLLVLGSMSGSFAAGGSCGFNSVNDFICPSGNAGSHDNPHQPAPETPTSPPYNPGGPLPPGTTVPPGSGEPVTCSGGGGFDQFKEHAKLREGYVKCVYRDSLGYPTVGIGHLVKPGDNLKVGDCISDAQVDAFFQQDAQAAWNAAQQQAEEIKQAQGGMDANGQPIDTGCLTVALASVNYQLGTGWTQKFPQTYALIKQGKYCEAANALNGTLWQQQTPIRVTDFQASLRQQSAQQGKPC